jgi:hypothetical protein
VLQSYLQVMVDRIHFLDGGFQMLDQVGILGSANSLDPGAKLARMLGIVLNPVRQKQAQFQYQS